MSSRPALSQVCAFSGGFYSSTNAGTVAYYRGRAAATSGMAMFLRCVFHITFWWKRVLTQPVGTPSLSRLFSFNSSVNYTFSCVAGLILVVPSLIFVCTVHMCMEACPV